MSAPLPIVNGVKKGCVLAPTLFTIFFGKILKQDAEDLDEAIKKVTSPGGYSSEFLVGVCRPGLQIPTLFQT